MRGGFGTFFDEVEVRHGNRTTSEEPMCLVSMNLDFLLCMDLPTVLYLVTFSVLSFLEAVVATDWE